MPTFTDRETSEQDRTMIAIHCCICSEILYMGPRYAITIVGDITKDTCGSPKCVKALRERQQNAKHVTG